MNNYNKNICEEWEIKFFGLVIKVKNPTHKGIVILAMLLSFFIIWLKL